MKEIVDVLVSLKEMHRVREKLCNLGVDLTNHNDDAVIRLIASRFLKKNRENAYDVICWWLYERVDKKITLKGGEIVDVSEAKDFARWLKDFFND